MTDEEVAKYYSHYGATQAIDSMKKGIPRLRRHIEATATVGEPVALGTVAGMLADLHALEKLPEPTYFQRGKAHEIRDMLAVMGLMGGRSYKG